MPLTSQVPPTRASVGQAAAGEQLLERLETVVVVKDDGRTKPGKRRDSCP